MIYALPPFNMWLLASSDVGLYKVCFPSSHRFLCFFFLSPKSKDFRVTNSEINLSEELTSLSPALSGKKFCQCVLKYFNFSWLEKVPSSLISLIFIYFCNRFLLRQRKCVFSLQQRKYFDFFFFLSSKSKQPCSCRPRCCAHLGLAVATMNHLLCYQRREIHPLFSRAGMSTWPRTTAAVKNQRNPRWHASGAHCFSVMWGNAIWLVTGHLHHGLVAATPSLFNRSLGLADATCAQLRFQP